MPERWRVRHLIPEGGEELNIWPHKPRFAEEPGAFLADVSVWQPRRLGVVAALARLIKANINEGS